jgi:NAD(P)-dependent dehydrogenase (short-subunit alcohol dehydrogenase family)
VSGEAVPRVDMDLLDAALTLSDRVAVVTGGGRGLGRAMALGLAGAGCRVVITAARETQEIAALAAEGGAERILALTADVTREEDCARVVQATLSRFGRFDILVNNAGRGMKYVSERFLTEPTRFWEIGRAHV